MWLQQSSPTASACVYPAVDTARLLKQQWAGAGLNRLNCCSDRSLPWIDRIQHHGHGRSRCTCNKGERERESHLARRCVKLVTKSCDNSCSTRASPAGIFANQAALQVAAWTPQDNAAAVFDDPVPHHRHHHRGLEESERAIRRQQSGTPANPGRAEIRHHL